MFDKTTSNAGAFVVSDTFDESQGMRAAEAKFLFTGTKYGGEYI